MPEQQHIIGIAGGLGPYAHIDFERKLLESAKQLLAPEADQAYPEWILSSIPQTPDRTRAIEGKSPDPLPWLLRSIRRLESGTPEVPGAGFVTIPCNTAHHYLDRLREQARIPILDMIDRTAAQIASHAPGARVGILATTGTLKTGVYEKKLKNRGLQSVTPLDLGNDTQQSLVMDPIYGPQGIKAAGPSPAATLQLTQAFDRLVNDLGAEVVIAGCTEIPIALPESPNPDVPLFDPTRILAEAGIRIAYGVESLPGCETH